MITRAPAWTIAAMPVAHAACSVMNASSTFTSPSAASSIPAPAPGIASISESTPKASQGSGRTSCKHRTIPDLPELEPPFSTIT